VGLSPPSMFYLYAKLDPFVDARDAACCFMLPTTHLCFADCHSRFVVHLDTDECSQNDGGCHSAADCLNTVGSYCCACRYGYYENAFGCAGTTHCNWCLSVGFCISLRTTVNCVVVVVVVKVYSKV